MRQWLDADNQPNHHPRWIKDEWLQQREHEGIVIFTSRQVNSMLAKVIFMLILVSLELKCLRWIQFPDRELELDGVLSRFKGEMSIHLACTARYWLVLLPNRFAPGTFGSDRFLERNWSRSKAHCRDEAFALLESRWNQSDRWRSWNAERFDWTREALFGPHVDHRSRTLAINR